MKLSVTIVLITIIVAMPFVASQAITPLDCGELSEGNFVAENEFYNYEDICFYGAGFGETQVEVKLEDSDGSTYTQNIDSKNGIVSSVSSGLTNFFSGVTEGIYRLLAVFAGKEVEYSQEIVVTQEISFDDVKEPEAEIPEFTTIGASLALLGATFWISRKRKQGDAL